jgi:hypothetical protein
MPSDIARVSYDENQQYRSVVMQQGRVTLEADSNEAKDISTEELRKETLEIVGPSGTPDNGYAITPSPNLDFSIGPGTMYVGGERVYLLPQSLLYSQQNQLPKPTDPPRAVEWLDSATDPDWLALPTSLGKQPPELVYLQLREQEVSAVEDSDLKDVALGGPDTAQRTRLVQHILRQPGTCARGAETLWVKEGLSFNPNTMRLMSRGLLQVGFTNQAPPPDPCQPQAQSGYLGADNQLIRVQIVDPARNPPAPPPPPPVPAAPAAIRTLSTGAAATPGNLLWGYDDASFLYRTDVMNSTTLHLQTAPADAFHQPRAGQAVEVLVPAVQLSNGEFMAAPTGFVTTVATAYNPDTQTIVLATPLPLDYGDGTAAHPSPPRVFLRIWEQELPFTPGVPVPLAATGLQVTLTLDSTGIAFHPGDFWMFAARPSTPQRIYPERIQNAPQPPSGPRLWACPLAVLTWDSATPGPVGVQDCRHLFSPLTKLVFAAANGGTPVGPRSTLNFIGTGVTVADNPATAAIDVTIPGGAASESSPTILLFPFVTSPDPNATQTGLDTEIVISNTTAPFGPGQSAGSSGNCTIYYFGTSPGTTPTFPLAPGEQRRFTLSATAKGFVGYIIVQCEFAGAYGFARIFGPAAVGAPASMTSYLAVVLPKR